jgi:hypothetical protein
VAIVVLESGVGKAVVPVAAMVIGGPVNKESMAIPGLLVGTGSSRENIANPGLPVEMGEDVGIATESNVSSDTGGQSTHMTLAAAEFHAGEESRGAAKPIGERLRRMMKVG